MTEAQWLACEDPKPMLEFLQGKSLDRKLRLFSCACCRRVWHLLAKGPSRAAVKSVETFKARSLKKLHIRSRVDIVRYAVRSGWLTEDAPDPTPTGSVG